MNSTPRTEHATRCRSPAAIEAQRQLTGLALEMITWRACRDLRQGHEHLRDQRPGGRRRALLRLRLHPAEGGPARRPAAEQDAQAP